MKQYQTRFNRKKKNASRMMVVNLTGKVILGMSKGAEGSFDLDYTISFWSWILSRKSLYFMEISRFRGYYLYFVKIYIFCGYYPHLVETYVLLGNYLHFVEISMFPVFCENIYVPCILSAICGYYLYWSHYKLLSS